MAVRWAKSTEFHPGARRGGARAPAPPERPGARRRSHVSQGLRGLCQVPAALRPGQRAADARLLLRARTGPGDRRRYRGGQNAGHQRPGRRAPAHDLAVKIESDTGDGAEKKTRPGRSPRWAGRGAGFPKTRALVSARQGGEGRDRYQGGDQAVFDRPGLAPED